MLYIYWSRYAQYHLSHRPRGRRRGRAFLSGRDVTTQSRVDKTCRPGPMRSAGIFPGNPERRLKCLGIASAAVGRRRGNVRTAGRAACTPSLSYSNPDITTTRSTRWTREIHALAQSIDGFLGRESRQSADGKKCNAIYDWQDQDALKMFSIHPEHLEATRQYANGAAGFTW